MRPMPSIDAIRTTYLVETPLVTYLYDCNNHRFIDPRIVNEQTIWEIESPTELWHMRRDLLYTRGKRPLALSVPLVAISTSILCLCIHDLIGRGFCHDADQLLDIDHSIIESWHLWNCRSGLL